MARANAIASVRGIDQSGCVRKSTAVRLDHFLKDQFLSDQSTCKFEARVAAKMLYICVQSAALNTELVRVVRRLFVDLLLFSMAGRKRIRDRSTIDREIEVSEATEEEDNVTIHGIVTELSPIKTSKRNSHVKYFTGQLSDGKKCMRLVSFDPKLRPRLSESLGYSSVVAMRECRVKRASVGDNLEIVASARKCIIESM